jgi:glycosyltransferase involved in cell wall biosynthesis
VPEVSVVIPTFNAAAFLRGALESVFTQTFSDHEIIVVDDGSTDETAEVLGSLPGPLRLLRQQNQGVSRARNRGVSESRAPWVAFLDADDLWLPRKLERQMDALRGQPDRAVCATAFTVVDERLEPIERRGCSPGPDLRDLLLQGNLIGTPSTVVCRRSLVLEAGGFDESLSQCADWDLWLRLRRRSPFVCLNESLVLYRTHATNMSRSVRLLERDSVKMLEGFFARGSSEPGIGNLRDQSLASNWRVLAGSYWRAGHRLRALLCACRSLLRDRRQLRPLLQGAARLGGRL